MLEHLEVLCFILEVLVRILSSHWVDTHLGLSHLLRDLTGRCLISVWSLWGK